MAEQILNSGKAFKKFKEIIKAQNGSLRKIKDAKFYHNIISSKTGKIKEINNKKINSLARVAGCPIDKPAGIYLYAHVNDKIKKGDKILTIYAESSMRLKEAIKSYNNLKPITIR